MRTSMSRYIRLTKGLNDKGILIKPEELDSHIDSSKDYYTSVFYYNEEQLNKFKVNGSVKGIRDVVTDKIWFDFDSKENPELAQKDAVEVVNRLKKTGINEKNIEIYYSGGKGMHVLVTLNKTLTPQQVQTLAINKFGRDLETLDVSLYDPAQIIRVPGTKHNKTNYYKVPLTFTQLKNMSMDEVKQRASSLDNIKEDFEWEIETPNEDFFFVKEEPKKEVKPINLENTLEMDLQTKPKNWKPWKWALLQGHFEQGERHNALMVLASTCRAHGFDKISTYHLCKGALKKQSERTGQEEFNKEELWNNIIEESVFSDGWQGGQYSPKTNPWVKKYCERMGFDTEEKIESPIISINEMGEKFSDFASDFDKNVIKTGLVELDENLMLCSSTLNGLLGQPGSGKTSMSLNYLRNTSLNGIPSTFFSLDMGMPIVFAKLFQKKTGMNFKQVLNMYKNKDKRIHQINEEIKNEYKNVGFNYKSGLTVNDLKTTIVNQEQSMGKKVKLVIVDYLECLAGPFSDSTANSGFIANQLKDLANELEVCVMLLLQTQKHSTPEISDPLLSLKQVKGSSLTEQACSTILTMWREGYNPKYVQDDKYVSFAIVKNRFGSLWSGDFGWNGITGDIRGLADEEKEQLDEFRKFKKEQRMKEKQENEGWG